MVTYICTLGSERKSPLQFKSPTGQYYLQALFYETTGLDKSTVLYTLKDEPHEGYPSLYQLYMAASDPTEYTFARSALGGWKHWDRLSRSAFFAEFIAAWRQELQIKLASQAWSKIVEIAASGTKEAFPANRYLLEATQKPKDAFKSWAGRKAAQKEITHQEASYGLIEADAKRLLNS